MVRGYGEGSSACDDPADVPWLTVSPTGATTAPGASRNVSVGFDSTGLALGTYSAVLCVTDLVAAQTLAVAADLGLDVPGEVSVIGFDDVAVFLWRAGQRVTALRAIRAGRPDGTADRKMRYATGQESAGEWKDGMLAKPAPTSTPGAPSPAPDAAPPADGAPTAQPAPSSVPTSGIPATD